MERTVTLDGDRVGSSTWRGLKAREELCHSAVGRGSDSITIEGYNPIESITPQSDRKCPLTGRFLKYKQFRKFQRIIVLVHCPFYKLLGVDIFLLLFLHCHLC